jgi:hypothetical protein
MAAPPHPCQSPTERWRDSHSFNSYALVLIDLKKSLEGQVAGYSEMIEKSAHHVLLSEKYSGYAYSSMI